MDPTDSTTTNQPAETEKTTQGTTQGSFDSRPRGFAGEPVESLVEEAVSLNASTVHAQAPSGQPGSGPDVEERSEGLRKSADLYQPTAGSSVLSAPRATVVSTAIAVVEALALLVIFVWWIAG